jgi:hypothetical protein
VRSLQGRQEGPVDTGAIREALLAGHAWISWLQDDRLAD